MLLFAAIPIAGYGQAASSTSFSLVDKSAISTKTDGSASSIGYGRILPNAGQTTPSGVAIYGYTLNNVLIGEAGVPASPLIKNGRIYAEVGPNGFSGAGKDIGLAIANPNSSSATINYTFTNLAGQDVGSGVFNLPAGQQSASYLEQSNWKVPLNFQGTFTFNSNAPISVVALQQYTNARGEGLFTTLPVLNLDASTATTPAVLSQFADGAGWTTDILLVNPTNNPISGTIQFLTGTTGAPLSLTIGGSVATSFSYNISSHSSYKLSTTGTNGFTGAQPATGSVVVTPASGSVTPFSLAVFSYATNTIIAQAGVPSSLGRSFRAYVEATTNFGAPGSYSTGFAVANASSTPGSITLALFNPDGSPTAYSATLPLLANGQFAKFLSDVFPSLPLPFQGILRITTTTPQISVVALRIRFNQRAGEFLETTTPATEENGTPPTGEYDFPQIADGFGFTTQFVLFSGYNNQATSGTLSFVNPNAQPLSLKLTSTVSAPAPVLMSINPTSVTAGQTLTLTGSGFTSTSTVVFTTNNSGTTGTISVAPSTQSSTSLTVTVPSNAITGPVAVANGSSASSSILLTVTGSGGALVQTAVTVNASATSAADIYVPTPVAGLVFTGVGVGAPGSSIGETAASAAIARGASMQLLAVGTGFTSTTAVTVSGPGVTLSNTNYQLVSQGAIFVNIAIDPSAPPGYRNVIVTNTNGDTSIMSGGLLIQ